jgi:hypothetical protein
MNIEEFVKQNIVKINDGINEYKNGYDFNDLEIKNYLHSKLKQDILNTKHIELLFEEINNVKFVKSKIKDIANKYLYYAPHLQDFYQANIFAKVFKNVDTENLTNAVLDYLQNQKNVNKLEVKFIEKDLKVLINKSLFVASQGGFSSDLQAINSGLRVANEGDSAQFLFVARAILAGFNCSNVDVRSSRYDAIIDCNGTLLRIQIKGVTAGSTISFVDRDRGGQGIDHTHERNRGKRITKKDCDIYVAVDKQVGICYIIPMSFADHLSDDDARTVKLSDVSEYLENWSIVNLVSEKNK